MPKYDLRYFHKCEGYPQSPRVNYMNWAARMAVGMDTGVPWVMCKQDDAQDPVVSSIINTHVHIYMIISLTGHLVTPVSG